MEKIGRHLGGKRREFNAEKIIIPQADGDSAKKCACSLSSAPRPAVLFIACACRCRSIRLVYPPPRPVLPSACCLPPHLLRPPPLLAPALALASPAALLNWSTMEPDCWQDERHPSRRQAGRQAGRTRFRGGDENNHRRFRALKKKTKNTYSSIRAQERENKNKKQRATRMRAYRGAYGKEND